MSKRKREQESIVPGIPSPKKTAMSHRQGHTSQGSINIQVITGSYDRILHGIVATIPAPGSQSEDIQFQDNFLFNAHSSAIRCLALSPLSSKDSPRTDKLILATGGTDEKVNLYSVSTCLPVRSSLPSLNPTSSLENPKNKELGSLLHHDSSVNVLYFPTKSKLISASDDNTIAISRTRDWTLLSSIKAPAPKTPGRPSGDTAPLGGAPSGINDFAVHPSMKLMISVGKGERCMRLWNLVTGKKASVLNFEKELLQGVGEGKYAKGEGQRVVWNSAGDEFAIAFEKGVAVFGMDSEVKCIAVPDPVTKVHQVAYVKHGDPQVSQELLLLSTEDGRLLFYTTEIQKSAVVDNGAAHKLSRAILLAYLGGRASGIEGRIKDFRVVAADDDHPTLGLIVTAGSDGIIRIWKLDYSQIASRIPPASPNHHENGTNGVGEENAVNAVQVGTLLGKYSTNNRITCLEAFKLHVTMDNTNETGDSIESPQEQVEEMDDSAAEDEEQEDEDAFQGFE